MVKHVDLSWDFGHDVPFMGRRTDMKIVGGLDTRLSSLSANWTQGFPRVLHDMYMYVASGACAVVQISSPKRQPALYSQQWVSVIHCLTQIYIDFHCTVHKLMWAKNRMKISLLTNYRIFWNPQIISPIYHWVSKLSQKWLLKVKNGMKSDNNVNKSLHWFMLIGNFPFTHHWL